MAYPSGDEASLQPQHVFLQQNAGGGGMIFKASPPNSADASRTGCTAGHRCTCSEVGAEQHWWGPAGPGRAVVFPSLRAAKVLLFFPAVGEKKAGRQLLLQDWGQQELCWPPRDLEPFREGMQHVLATFLCKQLQILGFPPKKSNFCLRQCRMERRERLR